jgi:hypothetical protein
MKKIVETVKKVLRDKISGGKADNQPAKKYNQDELKAGIEIEQEHTKDKKLAQEIAQDHLEEDPKYYTHLKAMESKHKK